MNIVNKMREGLWQEAIPDNFSLNNIVKEGTYTGNYNDISEIIKDTAEVAKSVFLRREDREEIKKQGGVEPTVSIKKILSFLNVMEKTVENNAEFLTYPKSRKGIEDMLVNVICKGDLSNVAVFFALVPDTILEVYTNKKDDVEINKRNKTWLQSIVDEKLKIEREIQRKKEVELAKLATIMDFQPDNPLEDKPNEETEKPTVIQNESEDKKMEFFQKNKEIEHAINTLTNNLEVYFKDIREKESDFNNTFIGPNINRQINESFYDYTAGSENSSTDWFLDVFIESQYNLLYKNNYEGNNSYYANIYLGFLSDYSNKFTNSGFNSREILNDKKFWGILKVVRGNTNNHDYKIFTNTLLPKFLSLSRMDKSEKIEEGMKIVSMVRKDELNFKTRLNLWLDIGGDLTMFNSNNKSIVDLLKKEKNPMWDKVLIETAKERNVNLYGNYPTHFENKNAMSKPTPKEISFNNRSQPF